MKDIKHGDVIVSGWMGCPREMRGQKSGFLKGSPLMQLRKSVKAVYKVSVKRMPGRGTGCFLCFQNCKSSLRCFLCHEAHQDSIVWGPV